MPGASAVALGIAQQAIEEIILLAPTKRTITGSTLAELPHTQSVVARTEIAVRAARHLFYSVLQELDEAAERDEKETVEDLATLRATMNHVADVCREALIAMYQLGSSSSIYRGAPLERLFRDGMTLLQHAIVSDTVMEAVGRVRLGMDPGTRL
jgi:alkylation response protein AidB-like acyl-CoA dehydrogenase